MNTVDLMVHALTAVICYIVAALICDGYAVNENLVWMIAGMTSITSANIINIICEAWRTKQ